MIADALHKIAADISAIIDEASQGHVIDLFALQVLAKRIEAQAEMLAKDLDGPGQPILERLPRGNRA